jgi:hypothetical protein
MMKIMHKKSDAWPVLGFTNPDKIKWDEKVVTEIETDLNFLSSP